MTPESSSSHNYWRRLRAADAALQAGDIPVAEREFLDASELRDRSPGRVFFSEKISDGLGRLIGRRATASPGRWAQSADDFRGRYLAAGETLVREGLRLAELRPEDDAERNQPVLAMALFLVARSRLFAEEPASAVSLLKGLFRTASRTGRPFDVHLVRHDLPFTEEDRLWLARKGGHLLEAFVEHGVLDQGSRQSEEWAAVFLQLLHPRYFGSTSRLEEERSWLEAVTADRLLGDARTSVERYRSYLQVNPDPGPRSDEARVRLLELLGNTDRKHFAVPRYDEALHAVHTAGLAPASELSVRFNRALARLEYRRPAADRTAAVGRAWASCAVESDGQLAVVYWWGTQPRDVAFWRPGEDGAQLDAFLAPCERRIVAADAAALAATTGLWAHEPAPWTVDRVLVAVMENRLPAGGLERGLQLRLGLGESGPWRSGWDPALGHPFLEPPRSSSLLESWQQGPAAGALLAGLDWLAVRGRLAGGDPALRAGVAEMAARGDGPSRLVRDFLCLDDDVGQVSELTFEPWTLPLLWTRADPFGWTASGRAAAHDGENDDETAIRPDLGRNDLSIVSTGNASVVLAAWGEGRQKWRVVLDRYERLESLSQVAGGAVGPVTVIPATGSVHCLDAALDLLEELLRSGRDEPDGDLFPLFHWIRLVETHNGDLLDFQQVRPRPTGAVPLHDSYARLVADLPRERPAASPEGALRTWADQFSQRVRKAGLVAGNGEQLTADEEQLDSLWGVFAGSDASWVFLDSAAVHWALLRRDDIDVGALHALLRARGRRHLSLLTGAVWLREELEALLGDWLGVYGSPYCLALTDGRPPLLRLACRGLAPDARLHAAEALAGQAAWVEHVAGEDGRVTVLLPETGPAAAFWRDVHQRRLPLGGPSWFFREGDEPVVSSPEQDAASGHLVVPVLASLERGTWPQVEHDTRAEWSRADGARVSYLRERRRECALELAALLAGPWSVVDVLDVRWWRMLRGMTPPLAAVTVPAMPHHPGGESAAALAAPDGCRTFDLPTQPATSAGGPYATLFAQVRDWVTAHDRPAEAPAPPWPSTPVVLHVGDADARWSRLLTGVRAAWERGDLDRWLLVVADVCPPGAADLVAGAGVAGVTVWTGRDRSSVPGPVVWAEPEDFADPALKVFLHQHRPTAIVVSDLADWLPAAEREAQETAVALRTLLACEAEHLLLHARDLTPPWRRFLMDVCGAALAPDAAPEPANVATAATATTFCPDCGEMDRPAALVLRLQGLLGRLRALTTMREESESSGPDSVPPPGRQLLSLAWLGCLAGVEPSDVEHGAALLRWSARLAGDPLSLAGVGAPRRDGRDEGHALLISRRYADLEQSLARLQEHLTVLVPLWFGSLRPGELTWIDLEQPPARIPAVELAQLDAYLMAISALGFADGELIYRCPRGLLYSTSRLVGARAPWEGILAALTEQRRLFATRLRDVMTSATETGEGFLVETGLTELRPDEQQFVALGSALGYWRWLGPTCTGALHLVDLLSLADSPTVREGLHGWRLLGEVVGERLSPLAASTAASTADGEESERRGWRQRLSGSENDDTLAEAVARVGRLAGGRDQSGLLVLRGLLGTGRHRILARGLTWARRHAADPGEVTIYCPDQATAAMMARETMRGGWRGPLDIRVPEAGAVVELGQPGGAAAAVPAGAVVVMCEVQRFEPETRYRIAQLGRGRRLLMTVDPASASEPWEHLFLTTPRADDICQLYGQRRQARRLWQEVSRLIPEGAEAGGTSLRREKGRLTTEYAANLDQCLARIMAAQAAGEIGARCRVIAPLPGDIDYLCASLLERGWAAVAEDRLDFLLLPGPREVLAAATDALAAAGVLAARFLQAAAAPAEPEAHATSAGQHEPILPRLLGPHAAQLWQQSPQPGAAAADLTLAGLVAEVAATSWGQSLLALPTARRRVDQLTAAWGAEPLPALLSLPLWEAWWYTHRDDLGLDGPGRRPLAVLTEAARLSAGSEPSGVYLCQGTEAKQRHYAVLGRLGDRALVLYQEISPFAENAP